MSDERKLRAFSAGVETALALATANLPGAFVGLFVVGESDGLACAQFKCNVEHPEVFLTHLRDMIDHILSGSVPTTDLRDTEGPMQ